MDNITIERVDLQAICTVLQRIRFLDFYPKISYHPAFECQKLRESKVLPRVYQNHIAGIWCESASGESSNAPVIC
ncbi:hypothetical protein DCC62_19180 [candidate division KSB1 bacterium]|nr:MAG: hypothetical protein DCC62_19180 [candidate division KSB1 bacterium]